MPATYSTLSVRFVVLRHHAKELSCIQYIEASSSGKLLQLNFLNYDRGVSLSEPRI
jgi:hypothetical protein